MNACQFIHLESYARHPGKNKQGAHSIYTIAAEAQRLPDFCPHILKPATPAVLYGCTPTEAADKANRWAAQATDAAGRRLRKDGLCLLAGVVSLDRQREEDWPHFRQVVIRWLEKRYAQNLISIVEHLDEENPHVHFYCVPHIGERFDDIHPGKRAAQRAREANLRKGQQNAKYKEAMREFQDQFFYDVARDFGLARIGPRRLRLTRKEWRAMQNGLAVYNAIRKISIQPGKVVAPQAIDLSHVDWSAIEAIIDNPKRRLFGKEYTEEHIRAAANAAFKVAIGLARKDEKSRWWGVWAQAQAANSLLQETKDLRKQMASLRSKADDCDLFTEREITQRRNAMRLAMQNALNPIAKELSFELRPYFGDFVMTQDSIVEKAATTPPRAKKVVTPKTDNNLEM